MASTDAEAQVVFGRLQLQERIVNQVRRFDSVKASLIVARRELDALTDQVKERTEFASFADDPNIRRGREADARAKKLEWTRKKYGSAATGFRRSDAGAGHRGGARPLE